MADAGNTHEQDGREAVFGGVINEDVMQKIWEIDRFPLPFTDLCTKDTSGNHYKSFTVDELGAQDLTNAVADGADIDQDDSVLGNRQGSWHQTSVKMVQISTRLNATNSIGRQGSLSYQVAQAQKRLRRDVEGIMLASQASAPGDPETPTASTSASFISWLKTNFYGGAVSTAGGFNTTTGVVDAPTHGTARALTETLVRDAIQACYEEGSDPSILMCTPQVKRLFSEYLFSETAKIAVQYNPDQSTSGSTAYGSHAVFASDFATVAIRDNRLQPKHAADESSMYVIDPKYIRQSFLTGYRTEPLAKTGLSEKRLVCVDYCLLVTNEKSQAVITDIDETTPVIA